MKRRVLGLLIAMVMVVSMLAGCGETETADKAGTADKAEAEAQQAAETVSENTGESKRVTALFFSLEGEYFKVFDTVLKEKLEAKGYIYESQSSNMDALVMIEQIENAVASGTDMIWLWPTSGLAVADACKAAKDAGVLVYAFVQNPGEDACHVFRGTDEYECGATIAQLASEWADKNRADAGEGEIKAIVFGTTSSTESKERFEAVQEVIGQDSRFEILESVDFENSTVEGQTTTENMFSKYDDIDIFLCPAGAQELGVLAYTHSETAPLESPTDVIVVGSDLTEEIANYIKDGSVYGTVVNGGIVEENLAIQADQIEKMFNGEAVDAFSPVDMGRVTLDNLSDYGY